jgi:receptor protein-tyrosine kinase
MAAVKEEPKLDFDLDFDAAPRPGVRKKLGEMLVAAEKLTSADVKRALSLQQQKAGLRFGDATLQLGLVSSEDVQQALSKQFKYEFLSPGHGTVAREISIAYDPQSAGAEAVRRLRSNLVLSMGTNDSCEAIAVVSPTSGDGRSFVAANLAISFAQMRRRTLLIDADLRRPRQHANFGLKNQVGFATILAERGANECMSHIEGFNELSVITAGPTPPNPQELLGRPVLTRFIDVVRSHFDVLIFDTPACAESADASLIANLASSAVLIARRHKTTLRDVQRATADMATAQAKVLGVVLNCY